MDEVGSAAEWERCGFPYELMSSGRSSCTAEAQTMSAVTNLLARRQDLLRQLEGGPSNASREDMERQIAQIDAALELLGWLSASGDHREP
jgi:hypothetical protein